MTRKRRSKDKRPRDELRADARTTNAFRAMERKAHIARVVRVVCEKCGAAMLNPKARGDTHVAPCPFCGCEVGRFYDVVLIEREHMLKFGLEEAA